uniref:Putative secreted protein n=1 Tax=Ixodes ricinus TaxID=34613 RepID=A0A147BBU8_IXORI
MWLILKLLLVVRIASATFGPRPSMQRGVIYFCCEKNLGWGYTVLTPRAIDSGSVWPTGVACLTARLNYVTDTSRKRRGHVSVHHFRAQPALGRHTCVLGCQFSPT